MADLNELRIEVKKLARPDKAEILQRFFKTQKGQYGEGDKFLGIIVPEQRKLVSKYFNLGLKEIAFLIKRPWHEERLIALLILVKKFERGNKEIQQEIYNFYLQNTNFINNWDLVDLSAPNIVGNYLLDKKKNILYQMAKSNSLWERRIAILATFAFIKQKKIKDTLLISKILLSDKHDLIHKAVGWMLREVGKRVSKQELKVFLDKNIGRMPRTTLRYAIERLSSKEKKRYLAWGKT